MTNHKVWPDDQRRAASILAVAYSPADEVDINDQADSLAVAIEIACDEQKDRHLELIMAIEHLHQMVHQAPPNKIAAILQQLVLKNTAHEDELRANREWRNENGE